MRTSPSAERVSSRYVHDMDKRASSLGEYIRRQRELSDI